MKIDRFWIHCVLLIHSCVAQFPGVLLEHAGNTEVVTTNYIVLSLQFNLASSIWFFSTYWVVSIRDSSIFSQINPALFIEIWRLTIRNL